MYASFLTDENDFKYLMFEDNLVTISDTGKELGEFKVTISPAKHNVSVFKIKVKMNNIW